MKNAERREHPGRPPNQWEEYFRKAGVQVEALEAARSAQARATILGNFLSQNQGREVPITVDGRSGKARLCLEEGGKRQRRYYFEITWDEAQPPCPKPHAGVALNDGLGEGPDAATQAQAPAVEPSLPL